MIKERFSILTLGNESGRDDDAVVCWAKGTACVAKTDGLNWLAIDAENACSHRF